MRCPECNGRDTVHPDGRGSVWCSAAFCRFERSNVYPETVQNRRQLRPVLVMGVFSNTRSGIQAHGWVFENYGRPEWSVDELYRLIVTTLQGIKALPGPASW